MKLKPAQKLLTWLIALILLMACILPSATTPQSTLQPQSPAPGILETIIVQTVAAAQTQTVTNLPSATSSLTETATLKPAPTLTPTVTEALITFAPTYTVNVPTLTQVISTSPPQPQGGGDVASFGTISAKDQRATDFPKIPKEWDCRITAKSPATGTLIKQKSSFKVSWTIVNNGTRTWGNNDVDFVYTGGFRHDGKPIRDLPKTISPGGSITLQVDLTAPKGSASYNVFWSLKVGGKLFCHMKHTFEVK